VTTSDSGIRDGFRVWKHLSKTEDGEEKGEKISGKGHHYPKEIVGGFDKCIPQARIWG